ncbi:MAG: UDP-2,3-diacylglucosamine diphosphatase LpxI [Verrucomicrobiota bacterium]
MSEIDHLGLIAGKGLYPELVLKEARISGVKRISMICFEGETREHLAAEADDVIWLRVGQLGKMLQYLGSQQIKYAMMAGQISPQRLYDLRPDLKAVMVLARLKERNAVTIFRAIADEMKKVGTELISAITFLDRYIPNAGWIAGPSRFERLEKRLLADIEFGWPLVKSISDMNIGQTIVVKKGTVLAVEGYDGTNETIRRGGAIGKGGATLIKVSKPEQDMRFDVPVIGPDTLRVAADSGVSGIVCEAGKTLMLSLDEICDMALKYKVTVWAHHSD